MSLGTNEPTGPTLKAHEIERRSCDEKVSVKVGCFLGSSLLVTPLSESFHPSESKAESVGPLVISDGVFGIVDSLDLTRKPVIIFSKRRKDKTLADAGTTAGRKTQLKHPSPLWASRLWSPNKPTASYFGGTLETF